MKNIALLGSTGSIGTQTLDVVSRLPEMLKVVSMAAHRNVDLFAEQIRRFRPALAAIGTEEDARRLREQLADLKGLEIVWGSDGLKQAATHPDAQTAVIAVAGTVGLSPTLAAISEGKDIALASKEVLVAAGSLVTNLIEKHGVKLLPIDSEHSAIFQCLQGEEKRSIHKILLTASGGALKDYPIETLESVTVENALAHPNWSMGRKITIDSATLMNKVLEVIEARWLFGVKPEQIEVIIHPQSIVHSMVEFDDGSVIAQLGIPDMRIPIQYALIYPQRVDTALLKLNIVERGTLTFDKPDEKRYPGLTLAYEALKIGGTMPVVLNAANEVAVGLFLDRKIGFLDIVRSVSAVMERHSAISEPDLDQILVADSWARQVVLMETIV